MNNKLKIKKGDTVVVITGKDKGAKGKVLATHPKERKIVVEGVAEVTRHTKPKGMKQEGGRIKRNMPIDISNVMYFSKESDCGVRIGYAVIDGKKVRINKKNGKAID
jgi:ribosomal protein L24, bacterial/organelle